MHLFADLGKQIAYLRAAVPVWFESPVCGLQVPVKIFSTILMTNGCIVISCETWFWIEGINMRVAARHVQDDYMLGFRCEMWLWQLFSKYCGTAGNDRWNRGSGHRMAKTLDRSSTANVGRVKCQEISR